MTRDFEAGLRRGLTPRSAAHHYGPGKWALHYVYRCYDTDGVLLYIGCTTDVKRRIYAHSRANATATASWWLSVCMDRYETQGPFFGREAGRNAEGSAIRAEQPIFNTQGRGAGYWKRRNAVATYLIGHGHAALARETCCNCCTGLDNKPTAHLCVAHLHLADAQTTEVSP